MKGTVPESKGWLPLAGGLLVLALLSAAGGIAARAGGIAVPGPVLGMVAYLALLQLAPRFLAWTLESARRMTSILGALIVPPAVGLAGFASVLKADALALAVTLVVSTLVTGIATAALFRLLSRR